MQFLNIKVYYEIDTKIVYLFDHARFSEACRIYCKENRKSMQQLYEDIEKTYYINVSTVKKYGGKLLDNKGGINNNIRTPAEISDCKNLGSYLCENEYAFLHKYKNVDAEDKINEIYQMLYNIIFLYDVSNCFNNVPDGDNQQHNVVEYYRNRIDCIQKRIDESFLFGDNEIKNKLSEIVKETRIFVSSFEVPGVADAWLLANPNLRYYDTVFDIMEKDSMLYDTIKNGNSKVSFRIYPTEEELDQKIEYFCKLRDENLRNNFQFSDERFFQDELLNTLTILFENISKQK